MMQDYRDRFYEDFYRVAVQNERFEDWFPTLNLLRQTFTNYKVEQIEEEEKTVFRIRFFLILIRPKIKKILRGYLRGKY